TIHVLTEVSSYAAFGLAWALGLTAMVYYLTATYRRSPKIGELLLPLIPGLPLLLVGSLGVAASYGMLGPEWSVSGWLFFGFSIWGTLGMVMSLGVASAVSGELLNRVIDRKTLNSAETWAAEDDVEDEEELSRPASSSSTAYRERGGVATLA